MAQRPGPKTGFTPDSFSTDTPTTIFPIGVIQAAGITNWATGRCAGIAAKEPFAARWTGRLVAPLTEDFCFRVYNAANSSTGSQTWTDGAGFVRVWLDNVLIIDRSSRGSRQGLAET